MINFGGIGAQPLLDDIENENQFSSKKTESFWNLLNHQINFKVIQISSRVILKIKKGRLWAGLLNHIVSMYQGPKYKILDFYHTYWPLAPCF